MLAAQTSLKALTPWNPLDELGPMPGLQDGKKRKVGGSRADAKAGKRPRGGSGDGGGGAASATESEPRSGDEAGAPEWPAGSARVLPGGGLAPQPGPSGVCHTTQPYPRPKISAAFPGSHSLRAPFGSSSADFVPKAVPKSCAPYGIDLFSRACTERPSSSQSAASKPAPHTHCPAPFHAMHPIPASREVVVLLCKDTPHHVQSGVQKFITVCRVWGVETHHGVLNMRCRN
eukprot:366139-Chlamydomonas_euryale.AAC.8